jgi:chromosome partitioning protein
VSKKTIAIANQKGGVGKTTTAGALIAGLSRQGFKVLGIDLDPQGNLSDSCGAEMYESATVYELMKLEAMPSEVIQHVQGFDIIPSNIMLAGAEQELSQTGKEHRLKESLSSVAGGYDYIIIDTPPSLGVLTVNAFTFANEIIIPTTAGIFAANGIKQLYNTANNVKKYCNPGVRIVGILLTRYNPRTNISNQIKDLTEQLGKYMDTPIYNTYIRSGVAVEEAQANKTNIFDYSAKSTVAEDYTTFVAEYLKGEDNGKTEV